MANRFIDFIKAVFGQDEISQEEQEQIKKAEEAGEKAAETVEKRFKKMEVEHVDIDQEAAREKAVRTNRRRQEREHSTGSR